ncbi:glycosyltransferase [Lysobacter sp. TY2-98]|uniref:glycosyltransferase family 2 protein n=1 Tax=Lysobacter sp. TY2-98 TaxID=2290922 RepID=UPI000E20367B|nr:glycosyltransferase family 2 protein [Lysobacter sp. TY2-98]AXK70981.1 glycosyltransferase [Lysobacter sp. TY2-98]
MTRISIVIATYNAADTLERCLDSITSQLGADAEVIVIDGGSHDGTIEVLSARQRELGFWLSEPDKGLYDAWNKGVMRAQGDYIAFLGADDALEPGAVRRLCELTSCGSDLISFKGKVVAADGRSLGVIGKQWSYRGVARRMGICHPGALHARRLFGQVGLFDPRYRVAADYEWMLRLPPSTTATFVDEVLVRIQDGGVSRKRKLVTMKEYWRIQKDCPRLGLMWASWVFVDRMWRPYVARALRMHY